MKDWVKPLKKTIQGEKSNYFSTIKKFLFSKDNSNVIFEVEGHEIPAHKTVLAMRNLYFNQMFTSNHLAKKFSKQIKKKFFKNYV